MGRLTAILALGWMLVVSVPIVPNLLVQNLENKYPPFTPSHVAVADSLISIVVLGAGHTADPRLEANSQLSVEGLSRLIEGVRIHGLYPGSHLVFSGGSSVSPYSQAEIYRQAALDLGVDEILIRQMPAPMNTREEAMNYFSEFGNSHTLILVTDAIHMPRAMYHFQQAGLRPIPAPTGYLCKKSPVSTGLAWIPSFTSIRKMQRALHETIGLIHGKYEWKRFRRVQGKTL